MKFLKSHWPWITAAAGGILTFLLPSLQAQAAAHPRTTVGILSGCIVAAYNMTAPKDQKFLNK